MIGITVLFGVLALAPRAESQATSAAGTAQGTGVARQMTVDDVGAFLDGLVPLQIERNGIAGAVVVVVKDGKVLFARGYGYSDVKKRTPVSPETTLFRPGSVSKLFVWTSVMQLVEQGKLDLDKDVNDYLDFQIPPAFSKPITLRNIMTHTSGFEEAIKDLFVDKPERLTSLREYVSTHVPARIFPPGSIPAYSNYATAVAGYVVERVSGKPYQEYIAEHIFRPLGMSHSTFVQPLPDALQPLMSSGYILASSDAKPFELVEASPAGSLSSSGMDMAHFIIAHLQDGRYGDVQILRPETAKLMHARQFTMDPSVNGMALGFYEESCNGLRIIGHGGDTVFFHSDLHLIPEAGVGFFVSYNSAGRADVSPRTPLWQKFLDRYFPYTPPASEAAATSAGETGAVAGSYISSRRAETTFFRAFSLLGTARVAPQPDGTIVIAGFNNVDGQPKHWKQVAPLTYQDVNGQTRALFKQGPEGRLDLIFSNLPIFIFQPARWYQSYGLVIFLVVFSLGIFVLTLVLWPVTALIRRHYHHPLVLAPGEKRLRLMVRIVFGLNLVFVAGLAGILISGLQNIGSLNEGLDLWLRLLQLVGLVGAIATLLVLYYAFRSWSTAGHSVWRRLGNTVLALATVSWVWFVLVCNLLSSSLRY